MHSMIQMERSNGLYTGDEIEAMATLTVRVAVTRPIPMNIFALAMRIETAYVVAQLTPLLASLTELRKDVAALSKRCDILLDRAQQTERRAEDLVQDTLPIWTDTYNLCGDARCDGTCLVCADGEYLGEEDVDEKYCRRGRR